MKQYLRPLYFLIKFLFYPFILLFVTTIPAYRDRPYALVSSFTILLFGLLSTVILSNAPTPIGMALFVLSWLAGVSLAVFFLSWGAEFDAHSRVHKHAEKETKDNTIFFLTTITLLLGVVVERLIGMTPREFTFAVIIGVSSGCVAASYYYISSGISSFVLAIIWLTGFVGFYVLFLIPALNTQILGTLVRIIVVAGFGCIILDYIERAKQTQNHLSPLRIVAITLLILGLLLFNVMGYRIPMSIVDTSVQICVMVATLFVGISYWKFLSRGNGV